MASKSVKSEPKANKTEPKLVKSEPKSAPKSAPAPSKSNTPMKAPKSPAMVNLQKKRNGNPPPPNPTPVPAPILGNKQYNKGEWTTDKYGNPTPLTNYPVGSTKSNARVTQKSTSRQPANPSNNKTATIRKVNKK